MGPSGLQPPTAFFPGQRSVFPQTLPERNMPHDDDDLHGLQRNGSEFPAMEAPDSNLPKIRLQIRNTSKLLAPMTGSVMRPCCPELRQRVRVWASEDGCPASHTVVAAHTRRTI